jgi:hypothetical protein
LRGVPAVEGGLGDHHAVRGHDEVAWKSWRTAVPPLL